VMDAADGRLSACDRCSERRQGETGIKVLFPISRD